MFTVMEQAHTRKVAIYCFFEQKTLFSLKSDSTSYKTILTSCCLEKGIKV